MSYHIHNFLQHFKPKRKRKYLYKDISEEPYNIEDNLKEMMEPESEEYSNSGSSSPNINMGDNTDTLKLIDELLHGDSIDDSSEESSIVNMNSICKKHYEDLETFYRENYQEYKLLSRIYYAGFHNFSRVNRFLTYEKKIKNYLQHKKNMVEYPILKDYLIINRELIDNIVLEKNFIEVSSVKYEGDIPDNNIRDMFTTFSNIRDSIEINKLYKITYRWVSSSSIDFHPVTNSKDKEKDAEEIKKELFEIIDKGEPYNEYDENYILKGDYKFKIQYKEMKVLHNENFYMILAPFMGEYILLTSWGEFGEGLSFEDFIKVYKEDE